MDVEVRNLQPTRVDADTLAGVARLAAGETIREAGLTVVLVDDAYIRRLNAQYLGRDRPTDVLAFPDDVEEGHLGDVVVSIETARRQAAAAGRSELDEFSELVAHGVLHLLGMDDSTGPGRQAMTERQAEVLESARGDSLLPVTRPEAL